MRILFVGMTENIHFARWISQLSGLGWDIHIFGDSGGVHPDLRNVTVYKPLPRREQRELPQGTRIKYWWPLPRGEYLLRHRLGVLGRRLLPAPAARLARLIDKLRPDCIHTIKMQPYGYQMLEAKEILGGRLPAPWIYSSWGRDTYMYRHYTEHLPLIKATLAAVDYYIADTYRDVAVARELGFKGTVLGVFPGPGGFDLEMMARFRAPGPVSRRRIIAVKGYQTDDGGQVLMALEGIRRVTDLLKDYKVVIHGAIGTYASKNYNQVRSLADDIVMSSGVRIEFLPFVSHERIWALFGNSRIGLAISRSDGTPVTMLEWMIMGAYPIESDTGGPAEWLEPRKNGDIVPCDDPDRIAEALRCALQDDALVDRAAEINAQIARERLDIKVIRPRVIKIYEQVVNRIGVVNQSDR